MPEDKSITTTPPDNLSDPLLYRLVVGGLISIILIVVLGGIILTGLGKSLTEGLISIGAAAVGGLVGLLAPAPARPG